MLDNVTLIWIMSFTNIYQYTTENTNKRNDESYTDIPFFAQTCSIRLMGCFALSKC